MEDSPGPEPLDEDSTVAGTPPVEAGPEGPEFDPGAEDGAVDPTAAGVAGAKDPLRFNSWMKRSATGAVMTGIAVGLQQALELPRQEPAFVIEASGEPEDPNRPIDLRFDPDSPANTVAIIRRPAPEPSDGEPTEPS